MHYNRPVIFSKSSIEFQITPSSNMHYMLNSRPLWLDKRGDAASHNQARRLQLAAAVGSGKWPSSRRLSPTTFVKVTNRFCQLYHFFYVSGLEGEGNGDEVVCLEGGASDEATVDVGLGEELLGV